VFENHIERRSVMFVRCYFIFVELY